MPLSLSFVRKVAIYHFHFQLFQWLPSIAFIAVPEQCPLSFLLQTFSSSGEILKDLVRFLDAQATNICWCWQSNVDQLHRDGEIVSGGCIQTIRKMAKTSTFQPSFRWKLWFGIKRWCREGRIFISKQEEVPNIPLSVYHLARSPTGGENIVDCGWFSHRF